MNSMISSQQQAAPMDWIKVQELAATIGDLFLQSERMKTYLDARSIVYGNKDISEHLRRFEKIKTNWDQVSQYGPFHPDYRQALDQLQVEQNRLESIEAIQAYQLAEKALDELFFDVSQRIASAVSEQIKVPSNSIVQSSSGCGGNCNGGCG